MNPPWRMHDLLMILPGITGSILARKDGQKIWAPAPHAAMTYIKSLGHSVESIRFDHSDPNYDDGVYATGLIPYTVVPGLARYDGYTGLTTLLKQQFKLTVGDANNPVGQPANYFEFPYDWRRDNRVSAQRLKNLIDRELPKWRERTDNLDAKIILVGHSMGGLIARYYIEALQGYPNVRALITFGTPHRGSVNSLSYLANGYRKFGINLTDLTEAMRTLTSVYQLLPRYQAVKDIDGMWKRAFETKYPIAHIDQRRAKEAYDFYTEIDTAYLSNKTSQDYKVELLPVVGWGHETSQSIAVRADGHIDVNSNLPPTVEPIFANGDGTVPRVSAVPIEFNDLPLRWRPVNQKHATLQNNPDLLINLVQILAALQGQRLQPARTIVTDARPSSIGLQMDEIFGLEEPVHILVRLESAEDPGAIMAAIQPVRRSSGDNEKVRELELKYDGKLWKGEVTGLSIGTYRITIRPRNIRAGPSDPVSDIFEIV